MMFDYLKNISTNRTKCPIPGDPNFYGKYKEYSQYRRDKETFSLGFLLPLGAAIFGAVFLSPIMPAIQGAVLFGAAMSLTQALANYITYGVFTLKGMYGIRPK